MNSDYDAEKVMIKVLFIQVMQIKDSSVVYTWHLDPVYIWI